MGRIRIVWGTAGGPTAMASYDAALAAANVHNYNLVSVSSVIPANAEIEVVGEAPDLGPPGERLTVVEGRATVPPERAEPAVAGLGWARERDGPGIFYEASGNDPDAVRSRIDAGLAAGKELRAWAFDDEERRTVVAEPSPNGYTSAIALAVYGESTPIL
ncbi:MAG: pyruvoyl-dependent arginine decarboxylase [Halobacteriota archaeon]|uniref:pyruvoyl-dependent arginine decarboxylase n=1 Tax=Natronomonas sp. TaxID=2184060 RepID=UPI003976C367